MENIIYWAVVLTGAGSLTGALFRLVEFIDRPGGKREAPRRSRNRCHIERRTQS